MGRMCIDRHYFENVLPQQVDKYELPVVGILTVGTTKRVYVSDINTVTDGYVIVTGYEQELGTFAPAVGSTRHEITVTLPYTAISGVVVSNASEKNWMDVGFRVEPSH
jgi:hypothetical protein